MGSSASKKVVSKVSVNPPPEEKKIEVPKEEPLQVQELEEKSKEDQQQNKVFEESQVKPEHVEHEVKAEVLKQEEVSVVEPKVEEHQVEKSENQTKNQQYFFRKAIQQQLGKEEHPLQKRQHSEMSMEEQLNQSIKERMDQSMMKKRSQAIQREYYKQDFRVEVMIQESHLMYDQQVKGLRELKNKDILKVGHLVYKENRLELVVREVLDLRNHVTRQCEQTQVIGVDDAMYSYLNNKQYSAQDNLFLKRIYKTIKGRMMEVKGTHRQGYSFYDRESQDKKTIKQKLEQGLGKHRVFNQVMQSALNIRNHLRIWDGTHHSQTKAPFQQNLLKVYSGLSEQVYGQQSLGKEVECCSYYHCKDMVFDYDGDVYVQLDSYHLQVLMGNHQPTLLQQAKKFSESINAHAYSIISRIQRIPLVPLRHRTKNKSKVVQQPSEENVGMYCGLVKSLCSSRRLLSTLESWGRD